MPEFNRPYTYGTGRFTYKVASEDGIVSATCISTSIRLRSADAVRFHLSEVLKQDGFRYLD